MLRRRLGLIILLAALLMPAAPRPAYAQFDGGAIYAALTYMSSLWGAVTTAVVATVTNYVTGITTVFDKKAETMVEVAKAVNKRDLEVNSALAQAQADIMPSQRRNVCKGQKARGDTDVAQAAANAAAMQLTSITSAGRRGGSVGRGGKVVGRKDGAPTPERDAMEQIAENCRFIDKGTDPSMVEVCQTLKENGQLDGEIGEAAMRNMRADALLSGLAYENELHEKTAAEVCNNIVANTMKESVYGDNILASPDTAKTFQRDMGILGMQDYLSSVCMQSWADRRAAQYTAINKTAVPEAQMNNVYKNLIKGAGWRPLSDPSVNIPSGYKWPKADFDLATQMALNAKNPPSALQYRASEIARLTTPEFFAGLNSEGQTGLLRNVIDARVTTLRQRWQEYKNLERQVLLDAIALGHSVRRQQGNL